MRARRERPLRDPCRNGPREEECAIAANGVGSGLGRVLVRSFSSFAMASQVWPTTTAKRLRSGWIVSGPKDASYCICIRRTSRPSRASGVSTCSFSAVRDGCRTQQRRDPLNPDHTGPVVSVYQVPTLAHPALAHSNISTLASEGWTRV